MRNVTDYIQSGRNIWIILVYKNTANEYLKWISVFIFLITITFLSNSVTFDSIIILRNYFVDNQTRKWSEKYLLKSLDQILQVHFKPLDKIIPRCIYPNSMGDLARKKANKSHWGHFSPREKANTQVHNYDIYSSSIQGFIWFLPIV